MEINVPVFKEAQKSPTNLHAVESKRKLMQGAMVFDKETNAWKVTDVDGNSMFIDCLHITGSDLAS
jgi:hypothetical protein